MSTYKKNFLEKVVFRFDYEAIDLESLEGFYNQIKQSWPEQEVGHFVRGTVNIDLQGGNPVHEEKKTEKFFTVRHFRDNKILQFSPSYALVQYGPGTYINSENFIEEIRTTLDKFCIHYGIKELNRVGLRYINNIVLDESRPLDWGNYINQHLLSSMRFAEEISSPIARAMHQLVFKEDYFQTVFNFGVWNSDFPNKIARKEFILDYDCYSTLLTKTEEGSPSEIAIQFNDYIDKLFHASITEKFKAVLNK